MKRIIFAIIISAFAATLVSGTVMAAPDQYVGDTAIYGGTAEIQPNVLIILDTSGSMNDEVLPGDPYNPLTTYPGTSNCGGQPCVATKVYKCTAFGLECGNWTAHVTNVNSVTTVCGGANPQNSLLTTGQWSGFLRRLTTAGACAFGSGIYATGNWINWRGQIVGTPTPKIDIAKRVIQNLVSSTSGVKIGLMVFDGNQGGDIFSATVSASTYVATVKDMDAIFTGTTTNRAALMTAVGTITASSWTPLAESLFEGMRYYQGGQSAFANTVGLSGSPLTYTSPIEASCQKNYIVIITDGMSTQDGDNVLQTICTTAQGYAINGDCDRDGFEPANDPAKGTYPSLGSDYLDDVAKYLYDNDMSSTYTGTQNVVTYTVGFGLGGANAGAVKLLQETAANGHGTAFLSNNETELAGALQQILGGIFEVNTSFVAPVVPVSPENRTYSGSRVYLGFFKPMNGKMWSGNLKKFGINSSNQIVDKNNVAATDSSGVFFGTAVSYWSAAADGGIVDSGGAGEVLLNRDFSTSPRSIYTYMGTSFNLTDASNAFTTTNAGITAATLGVSTSTDKDKLVNFVHGIDSYDSNSNGNFTEKREWILGDILHSKPLVVNYTSYTFTTANESDCAVNKAIVYVGGNDGMLHAFKDCDGSEAWAFIPQDLLTNLNYLTGSTHTYFVDSSASLYKYDANNDGNIDTVAGDKVIIMFGERRGGGTNANPTGGFYYALDVSNPLSPVYKWRLSNTVSPSGTNTDYSELGETWSEPKMANIKLNIAGSDVFKVVAFIGAGYDNLNEDGRYGATQTFTGTGIVTGSDTGSGVVTSAGTSSPLTPKGRGVYAVEIATLISNAPVFTNSGYKIWGYTYGATDTATTSAGMTFSLPGEASALDTDYNGYVDRLYVGDTGGNIWRFDVGASAVASWTGRKIFSANPGSGGASDAGRKIFYKPSVSFEVGYKLVFFGTGDREHPLNRAVTDRMYGIKDKDSDQTTTVVEDHVDNTHELVDVTTNALQVDTTTAAQISSILSSLSDTSTLFGWYIKLNENSGEKVLAPALVFNKVAYYTTYSPTAVVVVDPCQPGNLGTGRLYAGDYKTGEAVINYDASNDSSSTIGNTRASGGEGAYVLRRSDRVKTLGSGIPSGLVVIVGAGGDAKLLIGCGGALCTTDTSGGGTIIPLYWRQK